MEINYPIAGAVLLIVIALLFFLIKRNVKDEKEFEKELNQSDEADIHKEDSI